jgi:hypothetical protein
MGTGQLTAETQSHCAVSLASVAKENSNAARKDLPVISIVFASLVQQGGMEIMLVHVCDE